MAAIEDPLRRLLDGNRRFARSHAQHPDQGAALRVSLSSAQHPFAVVLACADSRVAPELIFDQGLGDLFVVRVAGNIVDDAVTGSIEYAAAHLHTPLVLVLGHESCGAVQAALTRGAPEAHIASLVTAIEPAVQRARKQPGDLLDNAVRENVRMVTRQIAGSRPILAPLVEKKKLRVVGGRYDLHTGLVDLL
jgi:carbonic anhydrase